MYKLIKKYPGSPELNTLSENKEYNLYPEFWEKVEGLNEFITDDGYKQLYTETGYAVNPETGYLIEGKYEFFKANYPSFKTFKHKVNADQYSLLNLKLLSIQDIIEYYNWKGLESITITKESLNHLAKIKKELNKPLLLFQL